MKTLRQLVLITAICLTVPAAGMAQTPDQAEMNIDSLTQVMMALAQPGPEHELLHKMIGTWEERMTVWPQPGADSLVSSATTTIESILGGRFILTHSTGTMFGQPVERYAIIGFDRRHGEYTLVALDNGGTYWITASGPLDEQTKTMKMSGEDDDPIFGFTQTYDMNMRLVNDDEIHSEVIFTNPEMTGGAPEFKMIDVVSKRTN